MKVVILYNRPAPGDPASEDVLAQARLVETALAERGAATARVELADDLRGMLDALLDARPDIVFNLAESVNEDPRLYPNVAAVLELLGVPFTGCGSWCMMATTDKPLAKLALAGAGLPTPAWTTADAAGPAALDRVDPPWIVKPALEDASIGVDDASVVSEPASLAAALRRRGDRKRLVEHYVEGREFNLSLLETDGELRVLPIAEIQFAGWPPGKPRIVGYDAKWREDSFEYAHTPRRFLGDAEPELQARLRGLARDAAALFGVEGYARVDFRVDAAGRPFILEVNANPCLSPDAGFLAAAREAGLRPADVVEAIVEAGLRRSRS